MFDGMSNANSIFNNLMIDENDTKHNVGDWCHLDAYTYARSFAKCTSGLPIFAFYELSNLKVTSIRIDICCGCRKSIDNLATPELNLRINSRMRSNAYELRFDVDDQLEQKLAKRLKAKRTNPLFIPLLKDALSELEQIKCVAERVRERTISEFNQAVSEAIWANVKDYWTRCNYTKTFVNSAGEQLESISDDTRVLNIELDDTQRHAIVVTVA